MAEDISFIQPDQLLREAGLRADQTLVHLGSGPGFYLIPAAHIVGKRGQAIGIDVRPDMLDEIESAAARENLTNVKTMRANLENEPGSPLPENSADWVLVANILHQSDPIKILTEAARITAANGHILVVEWDTAASPLGPPTEERLPKAEAEAAATSAGLHIDNSIRPSPYHYGFIASKQP